MLQEAKQCEAIGKDVDLYNKGLIPIYGTHPPLEYRENSHQGHIETRCFQNQSDPSLTPIEIMPVIF
jgi:hypothetical protein